MFILHIFCRSDHAAIYPYRGFTSLGHWEIVARKVLN